MSHKPQKSHFSRSKIYFRKFQKDKLRRRNWKSLHWRKISVHIWLKTSWNLWTLLEFYEYITVNINNNDFYWCKIKLTHLQVKVFTKQIGICTQNLESRNSCKNSFDDKILIKWLTHENNDNLCYGSFCSKLDSCDLLRVQNFGLLYFCILFTRFL